MRTAADHCFCLWSLLMQHINQESISQRSLKTYLRLAIVFSLFIFLTNTSMLHFLYLFLFLVNILYKTILLIKHTIFKAQTAAEGTMFAQVCSYLPFCFTEFSMGKLLIYCQQCISQSNPCSSLCFYRE